MLQLVINYGMLLRVVERGMRDVGQTTLKRTIVLNRPPDTVTDNGVHSADRTRITNNSMGGV
jgi:hypothetical protein